MVTVQKFTERLAAIREEDFTHQSVLEYLRRNPVDLDSLDPYLYFCPDHYTRNLIQKAGKGRAGSLTTRCRRFHSQPATARHCHSERNEESAFYLK